MNTDHKHEMNEKINKVLFWAEEHPEFDAGFVKSLKEKLNTYGSLTPKQVDALDNIIEKWKIE